MHILLEEIHIDLIDLVGFVIGLATNSGLFFCKLPNVGYSMISVPGEKGSGNTFDQSDRIGQVVCWITAERTWIFCWLELFQVEEQYEQNSLVHTHIHNYRLIIGCGCRIYMPINCILFIATIVPLAFVPQPLAKEQHPKGAPVAQLLCCCWWWWWRRRTPLHDVSLAIDE